MIEVSEKDKEQYHNGYELCCWLDYVRPAANCMIGTRYRRI